MNQVESSSLEHRLAQLYSRINYERQSRITPRSFKLKNMRDLSQRIGNPHLKYPVIHVAGTKGKGSVTTMIGSILSSSGLKTGVYTSPHLETIHQRIAIDGQLISDEQLLEVLDEIQPVLIQLDQEAELDKRRDLTFFEVTTAAMFYHFAKQKVDVAVIEVGLGGRLDSTNVCQPSVCVITNISHDHTKQLGDTLDAIAREKSGIIKQGVPVVSGAVNPDAAAVIALVAQAKNAALYVLEQDFTITAENSYHIDSSKSCSGGPICENDFSTSGRVAEESYEHRDLRLNLLGTHQQTNAAIAIAATKLLTQKKDFQISDTDIQKGLASAILMGRTEALGHSPLVIIDMAHNVASIAALIDSLTAQLSNWQTADARKLIMATSREKDAMGMIRLLIRHFDEIVFTRYLNNPRGKSPDELLGIATRLRDQMNLATALAVEPDPQLAWSSIRDTASENDIICISGSAFLVAELRQSVLDSQSG